MADITVYYDGECPLCRREISIYKGLSGATDVRYIDIEAPNFNCNDLVLKKKKLKSRFHIKKNGLFLTGGYAFVELWKHYPRLRFLNIIFSSRLMRFLLDKSYNVFLILRPLLQWLLVRLERQ
jgi:predicted DCC family thiol-disulfide oxidoreductase YuxK